jgi:hypothetical protein
MTRDPFWFYLRLRWLAFVIAFSLVLGFLLTVVILLVTLFNTGIESFDKSNIMALFEVASFWFILSWVLSFLVALIFSFKTLFNKTIAGKQLLLLECKSKEPFIPVILADVIPIWRKFLFWMVWILVLVALILLGIFHVSKTFFGGFTLFMMILLFGVVILKPLLLSIKNVRMKDNP